MSKIISALYYLFIIIILGIFSYKFYFVCDDAYISFQYARNLASGFGLTFNRGLDPVEGYTNFLWVIIESFFYYINVPLQLIMPLISFLSLVIFVGFLRKLIKEKLKFNDYVCFFTLLSVAFFPSFFIWSTSGLEILTYSILIFLFLYYLIIDDGKNEINILLISLILSLIRFEGVFFAILIYFLQILKKKFNFKLFLKFFIIYSLYTICRYIYFGNLFPNTVYTKVGISFPVIMRGINYNISFLLNEPLSVLSIFGLIIMLKDKVKFSTEYLIMYLSLFFYPIIVGGDFLPYYRFLVPFCVFQVLTFSYLINAVNDKKFVKISFLFIFIGLLLISFLNVYNISIFNRDLLTKFHFRFNTPEFRTEIESYNYLNENNYKRKLLSNVLNKLEKELENNENPSIVLGGIGLVAFNTNFIVYDIYGLVNKDLRNIKVKNLRSPGHDKRVKPEFFLKYKPYLIKLNFRNRRLTWYQENIAKSKMYNNYSILNLPTEDKDLSVLMLRRLK